MTDKKGKHLFSITADDCEWSYSRGSGAGGQKRNKTSSAVHCKHKESGAIGYSQEGRSQSHNKQLAFKHMSETSTFKTWLRLRIARELGHEAEAEAYADKEVNSDRVCVEVHDEKGRWKEVDREYWQQEAACAEEKDTD